MSVRTQSLLDRVFRLSFSHTLLRPVIQLLLLIFLYSGLRYTFSYLLDFIVLYGFIGDSSAVASFHSDQELLLQTLSLGFALLFSYGLSVSRSAWFDFALRFRRLQAGFGWARWVSAFNDSLLKGFLMASGFLLLASLLGWVEFEVSSFLDARSLLVMIPSMLGQMLGFSIWLLILEFFRRFLHRVLVRQTEHKTLGALIGVTFEAYFIFITFNKFSLEAVDGILLALVSLSWALSQMIAYQKGESLSSVEYLRSSISRYATGLGFWNALLFVYGAPLLPFKSFGFVNLLTGELARSSGVNRLFADQIYFLVSSLLIFIAFVTSSCWSAFRSALSRVEEEAPSFTTHQVLVDEFEFSESSI